MKRYMMILSNSLLGLSLCISAIASPTPTRKSSINSLILKQKPCMTSSERIPKIELDERFMTGDPKAPIVLTVYACGRSAPCAKLIPSLYTEIIAGRFKGKVRLNYRPFFPDKKEEASACARALVAAAQQGFFWPYLLHLYYNQDHFQLCLLQKWADIKGLDRDAFEMAYDSKKTIEFLAASRREGLLNKVNTVPSIFINNRKVFCEPTTQSIFELLEKEIKNTAP